MKHSKKNRFNSYLSRRLYSSKRKCTLRKKNIKKLKRTKIKRRKNNKTSNTKRRTKYGGATHIIL